jgi:hypothetical protein
MNPKDKAKELVDKFTLVGLQQRNEGIQCALIAVELRFEADFKSYSIEYGEDSLEFWQEVKTEIEKL